MFNPSGMIQRRGDWALPEELKADRTMEPSTETTFSVDMKRKARLSLRRYNTCGDDGLMPEVAMTTASAKLYSKVFLLVLEGYDTILMQRTYVSTRTMLAPNW